MSKEIRPGTGGSYVRDLKTGELTRAVDPAPDLVAETEPAANAVPVKASRTPKTTEGA